MVSTKNIHKIGGENCLYILWLVSLTSPYCSKCLPCLWYLCNKKPPSPVQELSDLKTKINLGVL